MADELRWGGLTLPALNADSGGLGVTPQRSGAFRRALDGSAHLDLFATKVTLRLSWSGLSRAELDSIAAAVANKGNSANVLHLPDGREYSVMLGAGNGLVDSVAQWEGGVTPRYTATLELQET